MHCRALYALVISCAGFAYSQIGARIEERQKDHSKVLLEFSAQKPEERTNMKDPQDNFFCCQEHQDQGHACGSVEQDD